MINVYADVGDTEKVCRYVDELKSAYKDEVTIKVLSSLLYVYARSADVIGTITQFKRIHEEFHMNPDTGCWNILLLAYVRAEDLDGALECLNNCLGSGVVPDIYTFGPLLDFCAHRGDVEAFETLFSKAKKMGVKLDTDVHARAGYVEAFVNAGDEEGAQAIAQGMLNSWKAGRLHGRPLTHTWNLLIQQRALDRDLVGSRERYKEMVENDIPLDSWTYSSLMRALVEVKQTNAAYKLLRKKVPNIQTINSLGLRRHLKKCLFLLQLERSLIDNRDLNDRLGYTTPVLLYSPTMALWYRCTALDQLTIFARSFSKRLER